MAFGADGRVGEKDSIRVVPAIETVILKPQFSADSRLVSLPRAPQIPPDEDRNRGSLVIYDLKARVSLGELPTGRPLRHAFSPGGRQVAVYSAEEISLWDLPSGKKVWSVPSDHRKPDPRPRRSPSPRTAAGSSPGTTAPPWCGT